MVVTTNNVPREIVYGFELSAKERKEFDYLTDEELDQHSFIRYRREVYSLGEFERIPAQAMENIDAGDSLSGWDGYRCDSYFSGLVVRFADDCGETVIVGRYCS